jgi:hypothetical protein
MAGRDMAQAVSRIYLSAESWVRGLVRVGFVDSGTGTESLCVLRFSFVSIIPQGLHTHILGMNKRPYGGCSSETQSLLSDMNHNVIACVENARRYRTRS